MPDFSTSEAERASHYRHHGEPTLSRLDLEVPRDALASVWEGIEPRCRARTSKWSAVRLRAPWPDGLESLDRLIPGKTRRRLAWVLAPLGLRREHADVANGLQSQGMADGQLMAVHVPLYTNAAATNWGTECGTVHLEVGEAWYLNVSRLHSVWNGGADIRVHLLFDKVASPELRRLLT